MSKLKSRTNQPVSSDDKLLEQVSFDGTKVLVKKPVEVVGSIKASGLEVENGISSSNKLLLDNVSLNYDYDEMDGVLGRIVSDGTSYLTINLEVYVATTSATSIGITQLPTSLMQNLQLGYPQCFPATNNLGGAGKVTIPEVDGSDSITIQVDAGAERIIYTTIVLSTFDKNV